MVKDYLEKKAIRAILNIEDKVKDISNILSDLSMKLCHIIRDKRSYDDIYYDMLKGDRKYS